MRTRDPALDPGTEKKGISGKIQIKLLLESTVTYVSVLSLTNIPHIKYVRFEQ